MSVHVPKTGNQKPSLSVHSRGSAWNGDPGADSHDPLAMCNHSDSILLTTGGHVDYSDIRNGNGLVSCVTRTLGGSSLSAGQKYSAEGQRGAVDRTSRPAKAIHSSTLSLKSDSNGAWMRRAAVPLKHPP